MGASAWEIVKILSWSFMQLLIWAGIIAIPIGLAENWILANLFTYYAGLNAGLMGVFFSSVFIIASFTIGYYAIRAANLNPAKSLRTE
jgi:putative ABC transport system permease protein